MAFHLYTGNDLKILSGDILCKQILSTPLSDPFITEKIIVQSRGMASWLKQHIAKEMKICANIEFPFLNNFINEVLDSSLDECQRPTKEYFSPAVLTWRIYSTLETEPNDFPELKEYLLGPGKDLKQYQLSEKIAETFDQYFIYRPDMVMNWENSIILDSDNVWQARLWQKLSSKYVSPAKGFHNFFKTTNFCNLPERITVFGISYMPLLFLDFFKHLGENSNTDVHFFYLNPCSEEWYYNLTEKEIDKQLSKSKTIKALTPDDLYITEGNKILVNFGQAGREFFGAVVNVTEGDYHTAFTGMKVSSLLDSIKFDILNNNFENSKQFDVSNNDRSIKIHNCHSKTREIEALFENILSYIENNPDIQPRDIFVMAPDISSYAPTVRSVFSIKNKELSENRKALPFSLSDISIADNSKVMKAFFDIINLNFSKFKVTELMDILETTAIHEAFDIDDSELNTLRKWIIESGMRWGINAAHRKELGLPAFNENSIEFALDRMFLGFAIEESDVIYENEIVPYDEIEISNSLLLGKFSKFIDLLIETKNLIIESDTIKNWIAKLHQIVDMFFSNDNESFSEIVKLRNLFDKFSDIIEIAKINSPINFDVIKYYISRQLDSEKIFEGFLRGKVTFCTMQPMRAVPAKIICFIGMNEGSFPREEKKIGFNILDKNIRYCDKSKTIEDRYIFLESLLAAQNHLYISYIGSDNKTNEKSQPSIAVTELKDYILQNYKGIKKDNLLIEEYLHSFNENYLTPGNNNLFTYLKSNFDAAEKLRAPHHNILFSNFNLTNIKYENEKLSLDELITFYKNPCKYFITKSLGAKYIINDQDITEDNEPIETDGLKRYNICKQIINSKLENKPVNTVYNRMSKECSIAIGNFGKIKFREEEKYIETVFNKKNRAIGNKTLKELLDGTAFCDFELKFKKLTMTCEIDFVKPNSHMVYFDPGSYNGKKIVECYLKHLALNCNAEHTSYCFVKNKLKVFDPLNRQHAEKILSEFLKSFEEGFSSPLPFFPITSFIYATAKKDKIQNAVDSFSGTDYVDGESTDYYIKSCFDITLFDGPKFEQFEKLSQLMFDTLWEKEIEKSND